MAVLIVCGSKSDVEVMRLAANALKEKGISSTVHICSAHRTPELLDRVMEDMKDEEKDPYEAIIAGAGLAAALPGVIASKTTLPVIGVPLNGAFEGLDSLLSIIQMPPGIPVLATGVGNAKEAAEAAAKIIRNKPRKANIVANGHAQPAGKASATLKQFGIPCGNSNRIQKDAINIVFIDINGKAPAAGDALTIFCPVAEKETATDALKLLKLTKNGVWVGLNMGENAAVAAAEIMAMNNELKEHRWNMKIKVEDADKEAGR